MSIKFHLKEQVKQKRSENRALGNTLQRNTIKNSQIITNVNKHGANTEFTRDKVK